jgi:hypothetical protein
MHAFFAPLTATKKLGAEVYIVRPGVTIDVPQHCVFLGRPQEELFLHALHTLRKESDAYVSLVLAKYDSEKLTTELICVVGNTHIALLPKVKCEGRPSRQRVFYTETRSHGPAPPDHSRSESVPFFAVTLPAIAGVFCSLDRCMKFLISFFIGICSPEPGVQPSCLIL